MSKRNREKRIFNAAVSASDSQRRKDATNVTHEPEIPVNWPHGHVGVQFTGPDKEECIVVTVHGIMHYLHATTARELEKMLAEKLSQYNDMCRRNGVIEV